MGFNGDLYPTAGASVVMTTKGDMVDYDTERQRLGIGSTGQVLTVASSLPTWATLTTADSVLTTQGDVLYESASGLARLGFGTSGDVLTTKGTGANPVWQTPASGGVTLTRQAVSITSDETTTSTSLVDTGIAITTNDVTDGKFMATACFVSKVSGHSVDMTFALEEGTTLHGDITATQNPSSGNYCQTTLAIVGDTDGDVVTLQMRTASDTLTIEGRAIGSGANSYMEMLEIS